MALLTPTRISKAGIADLLASLGAADAAGDSVVAANGLLVVMSNIDASPHTLTVAAPVATTRKAGFGDLSVSALNLTVAAGGDFGLITIPAEYAVSNEYSWTYDDVTGVTIGVFSLSP